MVLYWRTAISSYLHTRNCTETTSSRITREGGNNVDEVNTPFYIARICTTESAVGPGDGNEDSAEDLYAQSRTEQQTRLHYCPNLVIPADGGSRTYFESLMTSTRPMASNLLLVS